MPQANLFNPHMPEVDVRPELDTIFSRAREFANQTHADTQGVDHRQVIIVTPGRLLIAKDSPIVSDIPVEQQSILGELVPPKPQVNIAVISYTYLEALKENLLLAIPFFGFLLGFAALGHTVWVFEGHPTALSAGCRDADLLLVDSGMLPSIESGNPDWREQALQIMRGTDIKIIARRKE
ncbi:MAG: hypothetical protein Q7J07_09475 [Pelolinea sp.]|nr:hypothetical protein [Pelolinea sp.]